MVLTRAMAVKMNERISNLMEQNYQLRENINDIPNQRTHIIQELNRLAQELNQMDNNERLTQVEIRNNEEQIDELLAELVDRLGRVGNGTFEPFVAIDRNNSRQFGPWTTASELQIWFSEAHPNHIRAWGDYFSLQNLRNWLNNGTHPRDINYRFQYVRDLPTDNESSTESDSDSTSDDDSNTSSSDEVLLKRISQIINQGKKELARVREITA